VKLSLPNKIAALTLWQPWGSLIAVGQKCYETRSWQRSYRGLLAIHAAKRWTADEAFMFSYFLKQFPDLPPLFPNQLPLGKVLCVCELVNIYPTEAVRNRLSEREKAFGNYLDGRFAWELKLVHVFDEPIPAIGTQTMWTWQPNGAILEEPTMPVQLPLFAEGQ